MIKSHRNFVFVAILFLLIGAGIGYRYFETKSVGFDKCEIPIDWGQFAAANPFRDRAPEKVASQVIEAFQQGRCRTIVSAQRYCEEEATYKVESWQLTGRWSDANSVGFRFWVVRTGLS